MISGSPQVVKYLTEDLVKVTGGRLFCEEDPVKAADEIEAHIMKNRKIIKFD
jgi:hydroxylamine reductase (hybrid-cluster protein)